MMASPFTDNGNYMGIPHQEMWDAYYDNLVLGLPMGGSGLVNGSTSFIDCSKTPKTVTPNGGAALSNTQSKFYGLSGSFLNGPYLTGPTEATLALGNVWTFEAWVYISAYNMASATYTGLFGQRTSGAAVEWFGLLMNGNAGAYGIYFNNGTNVLSSSNSANAIPVGAWVHVEIGHDGTTMRAFKDGTLTHLVASTASLPASASYALTVGGFVRTAEMFNGFIQDFNVYSVCKHTANFTPPPRGYLTRARRNAPGIWRL